MHYTYSLGVIIPIFMRLLYIIAISFIMSCVQEQSDTTSTSETPQKAKLQKVQFKFSITKSGYTDYDVDKFHHIKVDNNLDVGQSNLAGVIRQINQNIIVQNMIDSLMNEVNNLKSVDNLTDSIFIDFIDSHYNRCQIHGSDCIFRFYRFAVLKKGRKSYLDQIDVSTVVLNNLPLFGYPLDSLITYFGEPDSVITRDRYEDGEGLYDSYFYGKTYYSIDRGDSLYYLESADISSGSSELMIGGIIINNQTHFDDFKSILPLSYLNVELDHAKTGRYDSRIRVPVISNGQLTDDTILLEFKNGLLNKVVYFIQWV